MNAKAFTMMIVVAGFTMLPSVKADDWNKETVVTLNNAVAVPGHVLEPGKYVFKLADNQSDRNLVQIFSEDQSQLITTVMGATAYRAEPGEVAITLEERPNGGPQAIAKWFFSGEEKGVEFLYQGSQR
jgi:hypothetical protein